MNQLVHKPDSENLEDFIDSILHQIQIPDSSVYTEDDGKSVSLSDPKGLRRVLKDGMYGVLWGQYSSKTRESVKSLKTRIAELEAEKARRDSL